MVWVRPLADGPQQGTPLVHDGIMYYPEPGDVITALDAVSGQVLWQHRRALPKDLGDYVLFYETGRNIAIYDNLIIKSSADNFVYALNADTGELAWETQVIDYKGGTKQSSGPIIAGGLAISGRSCMPDGGPESCFIVAHDARTGKEVWRTSTIAFGDDENADSWGNVPDEKRAHVGSWMIPSYDPELDLIYMGTSVSAPAPKFMLGGSVEQHLYHNSTLALDRSTGRIVWHYQHLIDNWDMDHPFERLLLDTGVTPDPAEVAWINPDIEPGKTYKVVTGVPGKTGIIYTLDRETGTFLWARPTIRQNLVESIDGKTGRVQGNPATIFESYNDPVMICPCSTGGKNFMAGSYSPRTDVMYLPMQNTCATVTALESSGGTFSLYSVSSRSQLAPGSTDLGTIHAVSASTGKTLWTYSQRAGMQSMIATGGGLVFAGDADGRFRAMNDETGDILWEMNLGSSLTGYPATFEANGQQYIAVSTGSWMDDVFTPELRHGKQNTLFVFALPEAGIGQTGPQPEPIAIPGGAPLGGVHIDPRVGTKAAHELFSAAQAERGESLYLEQCASCHGKELTGSRAVPTLKGNAFLGGWRGRTLGELYAYLRTAMPPGASGQLDNQSYVDVTTYLLRENGFRSGSVSLTPESEDMEFIGVSMP